ncbi:alpha/beta hydrolase [Nocardia sp. NPDC050712]|uniref:alpha/beta fold hydrolase n=1 Tax=Nocardia sp. NPDC050712 TaxID=3155518 RepID=UPI0033EEEAD9
MSETLHVEVEPDVTIHVDRWAARLPGAPTVLALHGFSGNGAIFAGLAKAFDGAVEVLAIDCRGRGRSSKPADPARYGMRRHADDAAAVLRALDRTDVVVVGTSMGAWISTQLAARHPDLVRAAILLDGGYFALLPAGTDPVAWANQVLLGAIDRMDMVIPDLDLAVAALRVAPGIGTIWDADIERSLRADFEEVDGGVRGRLRPVAAIADARSYHDPVEDPYLRRDIARITCPVHLVTAPEGLPITAETSSPPIMPAETVAEFQRALPQLTVEMAPDTNHFTVCLGPVANALVVAATREVLK